jgi:hypothetical protein
VATSEDQPKAVVRDFARVIIRLLDGLDKSGGDLRFEFLLEPRPAPDAVNGFMAGRLDDPGAWKLGDACEGPLLNSGRKSLLRRLFGHVEVAEESDQSGDDPAPIGAVNRVNGGSCVRNHTLIIHSQKNLAECRFRSSPFD